MFRSVRRAFRFLAAGFGAALRALAVTLPVALALATLTAVGDTVVVELVASQWPDNAGGESQSGMIYTLLGWVGWSLLLQVFVGPIFHACAVAVAKGAAMGKPAKLYPALNFALNRYKKMFRPHMLAWLAIAIGIQVIIPGILYWMMYAFVDSVAALEEHKDPRARSRMLTAGRRSSIFWMIFPFIVLQAVRMVTDFEFMAAGLGSWIGYQTVMALLDFGLATSFAMFYLARVAALDRAREKKQLEAAGAPEATPSTPTA